MGCFSFLCKECGDPIICDDNRIDNVRLYLLLKGDVMEEMAGKYNSYGCVDIDGESQQWSADWDNVCDLMESPDKGTGIAAIHEECFVKEPTTKSEDDPNQGWLIDECDECDE